MRLRHAIGFLLLAAAAVLPTGIALADERQADEPKAVYTRAQVRSFFDEADGRYYVRLKLIPRAKLPFTTQTFLVADRSLLAGIQEGASVRFTARRLAGENTLTALELAEPCRRFQKCE